LELGEFALSHLTSHLLTHISRPITSFLISLIITFILLSPVAYAAASANYAISAEVIDLGGAPMNSTTYNMYGKIRDIAPQQTTSSSYTLEGRFFGIVSGAPISTFETPTVTALIPSSGLNDRSYRLIINGTKISTVDGDVSAKMIKPGQTNINATDISVESSTSMEATFNMRGAETGVWNVVVTNISTSRYSALSSGSRFTVTSPGPVRIIGTPHNDPNPFNPNEGPTTIKYTLSNSAHIAMYLFNESGELIWQKTYSPTEMGGLSGNNTILWDAVSDFEEKVPTGVYVLRIVSKSGSPRELGKIKIAVIRQ